MALPHQKPIITIIIADDHALFREGVKVALRKYPHLKVVAEANDGLEVLEQAKEHRPDVILMDLQMPKMDGIEATKQITATLPGIEIIAMTMLDDESIVLDMIEAGARGYLVKNSSSTELIEAIEKVHNKETYYCNITANKIVRLVARTQFHPYRHVERPNFTEREIDIIRLICEEFCAKEIAQKVGSNTNAINSTRNRIREKIGAKSLVGVVMYAVRYGIYSVD